MPPLNAAPSCNSRRRVARFESFMVNLAEIVPALSGWRVAGHRVDPLDQFPGLGRLVFGAEIAEEAEYGLRVPAGGGVEQIEGVGMGAGIVGAVHLRGQRPLDGGGNQRLPGGQLLGWN